MSPKVVDKNFAKFKPNGNFSRTGSCGQYMEFSCKETRFCLCRSLNLCFFKDNVLSSHQLVTTVIGKGVRNIFFVDCTLESK